MKIKICGVKTKNHAVAACEAGADFIGMVFFEKSPRFVTMKQARIIRQVARDYNVPAVALTVNADELTLAEIAVQLQPDYFQFHGDETKTYIEKVRPIIINAGVIQVVKIAKKTDVRKITSAKKYADLVLLDSPPLPDDKHPGGNARSFDWNILKNADLEHCLLAGGLNADNITDAIAACHPWGIDVSSGVEKASGVKCARKIRKFIETANKAG